MLTVEVAKYAAHLPHVFMRCVLIAAVAGYVRLRRGKCRIQFDRSDVGVLLVDDVDIDPHGPIPLMYPALCATPSPSAGCKCACCGCAVVCTAVLVLAYVCVFVCFADVAATEPFVICHAPPDGWILGPGTVTLAPLELLLVFIFHDYLLMHAGLEDESQSFSGPLGPSLPGYGVTECVTVLLHCAMHLLVDHAEMLYCSGI